MEVLAGTLDFALKGKGTLWRILSAERLEPSHFQRIVLAAGSKQGDREAGPEADRSLVELQVSIWSEDAEPGPILKSLGTHPGMTRGRAAGAASAFEKRADDLKLGHELTAGVHRRDPKPFPRPETSHSPRHARGGGRPPAPYSKPSSLSSIITNHV